MKHLITFCLVLLLCASALGTPIGRSTVENKQGNYTGPLTGTAQDDNTKSSLDLVHNLVANASGIRVYVDSAVAASAGDSWATAVATVNAAMDLVTANSGDIILIAEGHSETLGAGADGVDVDKAGITIVGYGVGENRPLFDYDTNTDEFVIGADDIRLVNLQFKANTPDVAHAIDVEAGFENFEIINCRFHVDNTGTDEFTDIITTAAGCDNGKIINCDFEMGAGNAASAINTIGSDYLLIKDNRINGDYSVANIEDATTASIWITIQDNILLNGNL